MLKVLNVTFGEVEYSNRVAANSSLHIQQSQKNKRQQ